MKTTAIVIATFAVSLSQTTLANSIDYARVIDAEPVYKTIKHRDPVEQCWMETRYRPVSNQHRMPQHRSHKQNNSYTPTIIGGLIGGAVGNKVGNNKSAKKVGAMAGAVLGASLANDFVRWRQGKQPQQPQYRHSDYHYASHNANYAGTYADRQRHSYQEERCETEYEVRYEERLIGYDVTYQYNGERYHTRTQNHPGKRLKVAVDVTPVE